MRRFLLFLVFGIAACGGKTAAPRDQWVVVIGTDAPVPEFGDRLLIEVTKPDGSPACSGCRRQLGLADKWPVSFGILPLPGVETPHVRVRLYRSAATGEDGLPEGSALIDARGQLPTAHGDTRVYIELGMSCFGKPSAVGSSCDPTTGKTGAEPVLGAVPTKTAAPGSWPAAQTRDCVGTPPDGMVCVPGGAFLLGAPRYFSTDAALDPVPEHVVELSPFAIDKDEMNVGAYRKLVAAGKVQPPVMRGTTASDQMCTWLGKDNPTNDKMPVNCVTYDQAAAACAAEGKRLPTEAEWEFTASNRTRETAYPWGNDDSDVCSRTDVGLSPLGTGGPYFCLQTGKPPGPAAGGDANDVTNLGVKNLGGNVSEWVADWFAPYSGPCWTGPVPLVDPRCDKVTDGGNRSTRGSDWFGEPILAHSYQRDSAPPADANATIGFRCAKSM